MGALGQLLNSQDAVNFSFISWCFSSSNYFAVITYGFADTRFNNFPKLHENPRYVVPKCIQTMALHIQKSMITLVCSLQSLSPQTWKQTFPSGANEIYGLKIIFIDLNIMIWKWQHYQKESCEAHFGNNLLIRAESTTTKGCGLILMKLKQRNKRMHALLSSRLYWTLNIPIMF